MTTSMPDDGTENRVVLSLSTADHFELGGKSGNIVTFSATDKLYKGFKLMKIDAQDVGDLAASAALSAARRRGKFKAEFLGGRPTGGGGWLGVQAVGKAAMAVKPSGSGKEAAEALRRAAAQKAAAETAAAEKAAAARMAAETAAAAQIAAEKATAEAAAASKTAAEKAAASKAAAEKAAVESKATAEAEARKHQDEAAAEATRTNQAQEQRAAWERAAAGTPGTKLDAFNKLPSRGACDEPQHALLNALSTTAANKEVPPKPEKAKGNGPCDRCDGKHATEDCPFFKNPREKHKDATEHYSGEDGKAGAGKKAESKPVVSPLPAGTRVVPQPGDGSCLFHSLSFGMRACGRGGESANADALRSAVAAFIEQNADAELSSTPLRDWIKWDSDMTVEGYCRRMRRAGEWGGAIEMAVASRLFNVDIHVYEKSKSSAQSVPFALISTFEGAKEAKDVVRVCYSGRCHYDALECKSKI